MITSLELQNFKCFDDLSLPLKPLTLFTGLNAAGKSTSLQTLLLLAQTYRSQPRGWDELRLNGALCSLGTAADIINQRRGGTTFALGFGTELGAVLWRFSVHPEDRRAIIVDDIQPRDAHQAKKKKILPDDVLKQAYSHLDKLAYLSAARQVETEVFPSPQASERFSGNVGIVGQFASYWFDQEKDNEVDQDRRIDKSGVANTLRHQLNAWASELFPDVEINSVAVPRTSLLRLELRAGLFSDWSRPANIGYGLTYAFPILVAGLTASTGSTFIIDSPEAHLHPAAQAGMGLFLARMSTAGLQILIETHSDHIMDGVRIAVREGILRSESAAFHYFNRTPETLTITSPVIDSEGRLSEWPRGFFDQHRRNAAQLIRPRNLPSR